MEEAIFSLDPGGPYARPTEGVPATIDLWCHEDRDLLVVQDDPDGRVVDAMASWVGVRNEHSGADRSVLLTETCLKAAAETVDPHLAAHDCLLVPPLRYADGRKYCRVWAFAEEDLTELYHDLRGRWSVDVEAKRGIHDLRIDSPLLSLGTVLPELSDRQREAVRLAHRMGYYELPRGTTTADIADRLGVSRRTAEDHLRRAERKLVASTIDYL